MNQTHQHQHFPINHFLNHSTPEPHSRTAAKTTKIRRYQETHLNLSAKASTQQDPQIKTRIQDKILPRIHIQNITKLYVYRPIRTDQHIIRRSLRTRHRGVGHDSPVQKLQIR